MIRFARSRYRGGPPPNTTIGVRPAIDRTAPSRLGANARGGIGGRA